MTTEIQARISVLLIQAAHDLKQGFPNCDLEIPGDLQSCAKWPTNYIMPTTFSNTSLISVERDPQEFTNTFRNQKKDILNKFYSKIRSYGPKHHQVYKNEGVRMWVHFLLLVSELYSLVSTMNILL